LPSQAGISRWWLSTRIGAYLPDFGPVFAALQHSPRSGDLDRIDFPSTDAGRLASRQASLIMSIKGEPVTERLQKFRLDGLFLHPFCSR
jgi:hypothetical protein